MGRPYSRDLRERVVAAVEEDGVSRRKAAAHFAVGISTVINWVRRFRETGSVLPGKMGGHRRPILEAHRDWVAERIAAEPEVTLRELTAELEARGVRVSYGAMRNFVHREGLSFKKNSAAKRAKSARYRARSF